jgi:hypothetical protein
MSVVFVIADVLSRSKPTGEKRFEYLFRIALGRAEHYSHAILFKQAHCPRPHAPCDYPRYALFGKPPGQETRLMAGRWHKLLAGYLASALVNVEDGKRLTMPEMGREPAAGDRYCISHLRLLPIPCAGFSRQMQGNL